MPVTVGSTEANLLIPLYVVVAAAGVLLAFELVRDRERSRELGLVTLPLALFVAWTGLSLSWAILTESGLSFLGLGTQPPEAAWGNMLATAKPYIDASVWMSLFPGLAIMLLVLGCNFLGDGLRDVLDPRISGTTADVVLAKTEH